MMLRNAKVLVRVSGAVLAAGVLGAVFAAAYFGLSGGGTASATPTCTIYWTGAQNSTWSTAGNWSLTDGGASAKRIPTKSDYVCMSTAPRTATVALTTTVSVVGIKWPKTGSVAPDLTVSGSLTLVSKTSPSTLNALDVAGLLSGPGTVTVPSGGTLTLEGGTELENGAVLINDGTATVPSGGEIDFFDTSQLQNAGTLTLTDSSDLADENGESALINETGGTITYDGTSTTQSATLALPTDNHGTITATKGTLTLSEGGTTSGTDTGTYSIAAGAVITFDGNRTLSSGTTTTGAGKLDIDSGTTTVTANLTLADVTVGSNGTLSLAANVTATVPTLDVVGLLSGPGTVTVPSGGTLTLEGGTELENGAVLINDGTATVPSGGEIDFFDTSQLQNAGTLTLTDSSDLADENGESALINETGGTITYDGTSTTQSATLAMPTDNHGTITATKGTLTLSEGGTTSGTDTGTYSIAAGAVITFDGNRTLSSGTTTTGAGKLDIDSGTTTVTANLTLADVTVGSNGTLSLAANVTATVPTLDVVGLLSGPGTVTVPSGGTLTLEGGTELENGAVLINDGTATVPSGGEIDFFDTSQLQNAGTLTLTDSSDLADENGESALINETGGTITYDGTSTTQSATLALPTDNHGTITATKGTLTLSEGGTTSGTDTGTYSIAAGAVITFDGNRTLSSGTTTTGAGKLDIDSGTTTVTANLTLADVTVGSNGTLSLAANVTATVPTLDVVGLLSGPGTVTVPSGGTLTLEGGTELENGAVLIIDGTATVPSGGEIDFFDTSQLQNAGTLTLTDSSDLADENGESALINETGGTITYDGTSTTQSATLAMPTDNHGTITATKGTLTLSELDNLVSGTLTGGTYNATGGTLQMPASVTVNAATIVLGAGGVISNGSGNGLTTIKTNQGSLLLARGLTTTVALANTGTITVSSGTLQVTTLSQTGGTTTVTAGAVLKAGSGGTGAVAIKGGLLTGTGTVSGALADTGNVAPTGGAGPLTDTATYVQTAPGVLTIPISGTTNPGTDFGQLKVTGTAKLGGTLAIQTAPGYLPPIGTTYTILTGSSVTGTFGTVTGSLLTQQGYNVSYTGTSVVLTVVPAPTVTSISPTKGPQSAGTTVTITGTNLTGATVAFGGTPATSVNVNAAGTQATVTAPAGTGTVDVTATTGGGTSSTSAADRFTYVPPPTITAITPIRGPLAGGTTVTITGTNLTGSTVAFGGKAATKVTINASGTKITATSPAGSGTVNVVATTVGGPSATSTADQFTYLGKPTITGVSPSSGTTGGGYSVTVSGTNLAGETAVKFGSTAATNVSVNGAGTSLTATAPAGAAGTVDITVVNPLYTSAAASADQFTYVLPAVSVGNVSQAEGNPPPSTNPMNFTVNLSGPSPSTVTVAYATQDQTATSPSDYTAVSGTVTFSPGQTSQTVAVPIVADTTNEPNETFLLNLTSATNATGTPTSATGTILNDDPPTLLQPKTITVAAPTKAQGKITLNETDNKLCGSGSCAASAFPIASWNLIHQSFGDTYPLTWNTSGTFSLTIPYSTNNPNPTLQITFSITDSEGLTSNQVVLTIKVGSG